MSVERTKLTHAYWLLTLVMVILLTLLTIGMYLYQWDLLIERETKSLKYDLGMAKEFIKDDIARENYDHIEQFFQLWAKHNPNILSVKAIADNGFILGSYTSNKQVQNTIIAKDLIDGLVSLSLQVEFDASSIEEDVEDLLVIIISVNILVILFLMLVMWLIMRRYLLNPLRTSEDKLFDLATVDQLTKIYNRHTFFHESNKEIDRCKRNHHPLCMAMIDLDNFKRVNDNFGHAIGDLVLILLSTEVQLQIRGYDIIGRIGGEEFALCLPELSIEQGHDAVKRICKKINRLPKLEGDIEQIISVSIGITEMTPDDSVESLLKRADEGLYQAKNEGRNCVRRV